MEMKSHGKRMKGKVHLEVNDALQSILIMFLRRLSGKQTVKEEAEQEKRIQYIVVVVASSRYMLFVCSQFV